MRRLLWLLAVIGALFLSSCGGSEKKTSPQDVIGDEEYRVMSAVLKAEKTEINNRRVYPMPPPVRDELVSIESSVLSAKDEAKEDSLIRRFGRLALDVDRDKDHDAGFFDTLIMRFGSMAKYVLRDSVNGKVAYDSLSRKYGDLTYYLVLWDSTSGEIADSFVIRAKEFAGMISPELIQSYNDNNHEQHALKRDHFGDSLIVELISYRDFDTTLAPRDWWPAFHERYPLSGGNFTLSRVGFNADTSVALISVVAASGPRSGVGLYFLLDKEEGRWVVVAEEPYLWI